MIEERIVVRPSVAATSPFHTAAAIFDVASTTSRCEVLSHLGQEPFEHDLVGAAQRRPRCLLRT